MPAPRSVPPLFDSHCHLDAPSFHADRSRVIARAIEAGVERVLVPAVAPESWDALESLRAEWTAVRVALGVHPYVLEDRAPGQIDDAQPRHLGHVTLVQHPVTHEPVPTHLGLVDRADGVKPRVLLHCIRQGESVEAGGGEV